MIRKNNPILHEVQIILAYSMDALDNSRVVGAEFSRTIVQPKRVRKNASFFLIPFQEVGMMIRRLSCDVILRIDPVSTILVLKN